MSKPKRTYRQRIAALERDMTKALIHIRLQRRLIECLRQDMERRTETIDPVTGEYA